MNNHWKGITVSTYDCRLLDGLTIRFITTTNHIEFMWFGLNLQYTVHHSDDSVSEDVVDEERGRVTSHSNTVDDAVVVGCYGLGLF